MCVGHKTRKGIGRGRKRSGREVGIAQCSPNDRQETWDYVAGGRTSWKPEEDRATNGWANEDSAAWL